MQPVAFPQPEQIKSHGANSGDAMLTAAPAHIKLDENGIAWIDETRVKVIEVALDKLAHGSSPEEMHLQYPHLSLSQIHAALSYYYDHQAEFDAEIERTLGEYERLHSQAQASPLRRKLRALGRL